MYIDNRLLVLNSKDALLLNSTNLSNCVFNTQGILTDEDNIIRSYVSLINAQIPCSFYNIDSTNNTIYFAENSTNITYTIPVGNYTSTLLIAQLTLAFGPINVVAITLDKLTGKLIFLFNTNVVIYYTKTTLANVLGITADLGCSTAVPTYTQYPLNLLGVKRISIVSDSLNIMGYNSKGDANVLATIEVNQAPFNMLSYELATDLNKHILHSKTVNSVDIKMFDENRNYINFNNINWTMTLCISIERDFEPYYHDSLEAYLARLNLQKVEEKKVEQKPLEKPLTENEKQLQLLENG